VDIQGKPAAGYQFVSSECLPKKIKVAGSTKALDEISKVIIPINIDGLKASSNNVEQNISIQDYLPVDIQVMNQYSLISLKLRIEKEITKTYHISANLIKYNNLSTGLTGVPQNASSEVTLSVKGLYSVLSSLSYRDLNAYVECKGLKKGKHRGVVSISPKYKNLRLLKTSYFSFHLVTASVQNSSSPDPSASSPVKQTAKAATKVTQQPKTTKTPEP
jgi:YbbR domain-containing protein